MPKTSLHKNIFMLKWIMMNTRFTVDFKDPRYMKQLKFLAADQNKTIRQILMEALDTYFSGYLENKAILKLAEESFKDWDNPLDAEYDKL